MIFDEFPCDAAEGVMLAHTLKLGGKTLKKGRTLAGPELAALRRAGIDRVLGARLDPDDVREDEAAGVIAALLERPDVNVVTRAPYTGRCNLHASVAGVFDVDAERLDRLNLLDEAVTIATLPRHTPVRAGQVVATVKIIPFAVPARLVDAFRALAPAEPVMRVAALKPHRVALVMSDRPGMKESVFAGTIDATRRRVETLGSRLSLVLRCRHERGAIESMLRQALAAGCDLVLVCGATVAKDRNDIAPSAVSALGGEITHFGMPVEPGNMLVLARVGGVPVVILPGCGRSARSNGLDHVLRRVLAGLPPSREDIMRMGVGGLIRHAVDRENDEEGPDPEAIGAGAASAAPGPGAAGVFRGSPPGSIAGQLRAARRDADDPEADEAREDGPPAGRRPRVASLVLAAGRSSRMGADNKLLMQVGGVPMVLRAVNAARASLAASVTVVVGHQADAVENVLAGSGAVVVRNPDYAQGMAGSLRVGLAALPPDIDAVVVQLGDMPRISAAHLDRLIAAFDADQPAIVVPERGDRRGNPILWPRAFFDEMSTLSGDQGARALLERHRDRMRHVEIDDDAVFFDVDQAADLAEARSGERAAQSAQSAAAE